MFKRFVVLAVFVFIVTLPLLSWGQAKEPKAKQSKCTVFMITGMDKSVSFEIIDHDLKNVFKKDLDQQYKASLKAWEVAKKAASKNKEEFKDPKPLRPQVKVLKEGVTKEEAETIKNNAEEEYLAKKESEQEAVEKSSSKFSVIQIKDWNKAVSLELIEDKKVQEKKKNLEADYKQVIKDWDELKKEAMKNKENYTYPKPSKPELKVLSKGLEWEKAKKALAKAEEDLKKKTASVSNKRKT